MSSTSGRWVFFELELLGLRLESDCLEGERRRESEKGSGRSTKERDQRRDMCVWIEKEGCAGKSRIE